MGSDAPFLQALFLGNISIAATSRLLQPTPRKESLHVFFNLQSNKYIIYENAFETLRLKTIYLKTADCDTHSLLFLVKMIVNNIPVSLKRFVLKPTALQHFKSFSLPYLSKRPSDLKQNAKQKKKPIF